MSVKSGCRFSEAIDTIVRTIATAEKPRKTPHLPKHAEASTFNSGRGTSYHHAEKGGATVANYSKYQQNIIKNYYDNKEAIGLQRLSEHVTEHIWPKASHAPNGGRILSRCWRI